MNKMRSFWEKLSYGSILLTSILLVIGFSSFQRAESNVQYPIRNFYCSVTANPGGESTKISISFDTEEPITILEISVSYIKDEMKETQRPYSIDKDNSGCPITENRSDRGWEYTIVFDVIQSKVGDINLDFVYNQEKAGGLIRFEQTIYVYTGNPTINVKDYNNTAFALISLIAAVASAIATLFIIIANDKKPFLNREETDE